MRFWIGNISFKAVESDIREFLTDQGIEFTELELKFVRETGEFRGFAFVEVPAPAVDAMVSADGVRMMGRPVIVKPANPKPVRNRE